MRAGLLVLEEDGRRRRWRGWRWSVGRDSRSLNLLARTNEIESIDDGHVTSGPADHDVADPVSREEPIATAPSPESIGIRSAVEDVVTGEAEDPVVPSASEQPVGSTSATKSVADGGSQHSLRGGRSDEAGEHDGADRGDPRRLLSPCRA
jgi:hypothetical protein